MRSVATDMYSLVQRMKNQRNPEPGLNSGVPFHFIRVLRLQLRKYYCSH